MGQCKLCLQEKELKLSHIIPRFAAKWLKETSLTGYMRGLKSTNRQQETRREYLLCGDCEQLLGRDEREFCQQVFIPYHEAKATLFAYDIWLKRFLIGVHWRVVVTAREPVPAAVRTILDRAAETWRRFLLKESDEDAGAEFHLFFADIIESSSFVPPKKANWYLARGFDATPAFNKNGDVFIYAKLVKIIAVSFVTPVDRSREDWKGTRVGDAGKLTTPQAVLSKGFGAFLLDGIHLIERAPQAFSPRQREKLIKKIQENPRLALASETFAVHEADQRLRETLRDARLLAMKGRDRNKPCRCGSGLKFKNCCGGS